MNVCRHEDTMIEDIEDCTHWVLGKPHGEYCYTCDGYGSCSTGIDGAPTAICFACNGTGLER